MFSIAVSNPFRYRGYYYDSKLEMYYLASRYYDPAVGRFINADGYVSTGQGLTGFNMFAYCGNNPVLYVDIFGTKRLPFFLLNSPNEIHNQVQEHIVGLNVLYQKEYPIPNGGRADIVYDKKEAYEIKPFTHNTPKGIEAAKNQLQGYIDASGNTLTVGQYHSELNGSFITKDQRFYVTYYYMGDGLIFYSFRELPQPELVPIPQKEKETKTSTVFNRNYAYNYGSSGLVAAASFALLAIGIGGLARGGFGSRVMYAYK